MPVIDDYVEINYGILQLHMDLEVSMDAMFIYKIPLLVGINKVLEFTMMDFIQNLTEKIVG